MIHQLMFRLSWAGVKVNAESLPLKFRLRRVKVFGQNIGWRNLCCLDKRLIIYLNRLSDVLCSQD